MKRVTWQRLKISAKVTKPSMQFVTNRLRNDGELDAAGCSLRICRSVDVNLPREEHLSKDSGD